ncbi:MAG: PhnD/SsuA/transferrin family substrate-binding protein [Rhabdochlamydiaceae bacterium]
MSTLRLSFACGRYDRTEPIRTGQIKPDGIDLTYLTIKPADGFARMLKNQEFDASEMSISLYLMFKLSGNVSFTAIPVFTMRRFFHTELIVNTGSGIEKPSDLKGKRIGVPEYGMSLALWIRGILQHEFDVQPEDLEWYVERSPGESVADAIGFKPPDNVSVHQIPKDSDVTTMLNEGAIDAAFPLPRFWRTRTDRIKDVPPLGPGSKIKRLFPDPKLEAIRYFKNTGFFPINHIVVIQDHVLKENPWVARSLFDAFELSKTISYEDASATSEEPTNLVWQGQLWEEVHRIMGGDPFPYGVKKNEKILRELAGYSYEQRLAPRRAEIVDLFTSTMLDT